MMLRSPFLHKHLPPTLTSPKTSKQPPNHQHLLFAPFQITQINKHNTKPSLLISATDHTLQEQNTHTEPASDTSNYVVLGAVSVGVMMFLMGMDDQKALALGPEGPLMEEFWDNVRRYGLYALTVSSGALYAIFQPIFELMKNPISAILVVTILGGGFFIVAQVVSAMIGQTDFDYQYYY